MIRRLAVFLLLFVWAPPVGGKLAAGAPQAAAQPAKRATTQEIARWIKQLNADQFVTRRIATDNLIAAGRAAVQPLGKALRDSNLEVATRGVYVLRELAICGDVVTEEVSTKCLEQLAANPSTSSSRLARESLTALGSIRQQRALDQLRELGAKIEIRQAVVRFQRVPTVWVTINSAWRGTVNDLQRLKWLRDVQQITFDDRRVTDAWLAPVAFLEGLERLVIKHARISDNGLRVLPKLRKLRFLDVMYTPVTDACLAHLKTIRTLQVVRVYGTRITQAGAEQLRTALTQAEVDYKNGAFLGVRCQQPPWPCAVVQVTAKSAAEKAGVRTNDIIIRYNKQPIRDFEDLRKQIALNMVGDRVEIQVVRGGRPVVVELRSNTGAAKQLGLQAKNELFGCHVTKVAKGGDAARAGIRPGDVIVDVDDTPVQTVEALRKTYQANNSATPSRVELIRNVNIVKLKVTFGEWIE